MPDIAPDTAPATSTDSLRASIEACWLEIDAVLVKHRMRLQEAAPRIGLAKDGSVRVTPSGILLVPE